MARRLFTDGTAPPIVLDREELACSVCGTRMHVKKYRRRLVYTLAGRVCYVVPLLQCPHATCPNHHRRFSPEQESTLALPRGSIGWTCSVGWVIDDSLGIGRCRNCAVVLKDTYEIVLSDDAIEDSLQRYQCMVAARQHDFARLKAEYARTRTVTLSIDGLQPEKGHETLYVVRELGHERVWFAWPLLSSAVEEIRPLIEQGKDWAERLGCRVRRWISDKQDAFVKSIASVCPGVPHRYCGNYFLRDLAKPMLELDRHAKVQMRRKVRGLRAIEHEVLKERQDSLPGSKRNPQPPTSPRVTTTDAWDVVLDYCAAVHGILNDSQSGPLRPPGVRMSEALGEVRRSLQRNLRLKKGTAKNRNSND